jgi:hypothetical protein
MASFAFVVAVSPVVLKVKQDAEISSATRVLAGLGAILAGLRPGMAVEFSVQPQPAGEIHLVGPTLAYAAGNNTVTQECRCTLENAVLLTGHQYVAVKSNDTVKVRAVG